MTFQALISYQKASGVVEKLLAYNRNYEDKAAFISFFCKHIMITGEHTDFVFRRDLHEEFGKYAGKTQCSTTEIGKHLLSSGLKVTRLSRQFNQEYGYSGIRFLDGRGRVYSPRTILKEGKRKLQEEVEVQQINIPLDSASFCLEDIVQKYRQNQSMWKDFLNYSQNYSTREDFVNFCKHIIVFTGKSLDFVFQKDLTDEFSNYCGETFHCAVPLGMHLAAAGVRKIRLGKKYKQEYGYIGMCFADGRGRKYAPQTPHANVAGYREDDQQQGIDVWPESTPKRFASDPQQSQANNLFNAIDQWETDQQQQCSAMAAPCYNDCFGDPSQNMVNSQLEPASPSSSKELFMQDPHTVNSSLPDLSDDDINSIFTDVLAYMNEGHVEEHSGHTNLEQHLGYNLAMKCSSPDHFSEPPSKSFCCNIEGFRLFQAILAE